MQKAGDSIHLSASDLVGHLGCGHLTELDRAVAMGTLAKPKVWDPLLEILRERGARHEKRFVDDLRKKFATVTAIEGVHIDEPSIALTRESMARGDDVIVQGAFRSGRWVGRADVLRRVPVASSLGDWSYEVIDTKLARETKGGTVLQLCLYADLVADVQGLRPNACHVVVPGAGFEPVTFRVDDYAAYYRRVKRSLEDAVAVPSAEPAIYPDPKEQCDVCRWAKRCDGRRRDDDHLCLVAGITKIQIEELKRQDISTMANLATMPLPLTWKPERGVPQSYRRICEQARIQVAGRKAGKLLHEMLPVEPEVGLSRLPEPSAGDIFFDLEGDPFATEGGREYLFGWSCRDSGGETYACRWAFDAEAEKAAFEAFIDFTMERLKRHPGLHIYHFAPYEPAALKRLMGRYATREEEVDMLLRSERFVDLYAVVKNGIRASVESYSIKRLEPLYGYVRAVPLPDANAALRRLQAGLELDDVASIEAKDRDTVAGYNRDDCDSTWKLRDWLEQCRAELIASGTAIGRPEPKDGAPTETIDARQARIAELVARLTHDVPADASVRTPGQQSRWLLANLLDWHRREGKAGWWEYFRLADLTDEDLLDERDALAGLEFAGAAGGTARAPVHRYRFPVQESEIREGDDLHTGTEKVGKVTAISVADRWIDVKKTGTSATLHPASVFAHTHINTDAQADALVRIGESVAASGLTSGDYRPARDLLMRALPDIGESPIRRDGESPLEAAVRAVLALGSGVLPIQGPPGSGKTHTGAHMICALAKAGRTVGVTANSHKVIRNLLDKVVEISEELKLDVRCMQKVKDTELEPDQPRLRFTKSNDDLRSSIGHGTQVAGATSWFWPREDATQCVDVLFVDEAAQMSLANVIAVSQGARSLVLLGDPQQLDQPIQGSHPEGADVSALHHLLGGGHVISPEQGLFLAETWRLHPAICAFTSELFYEGKLGSHPGLERQAIRSNCPFDGTGLRYVPVPTQGNQSSSPEEAECVAKIVGKILAAGTTWIDRHGEEKKVTLKDILIVAPYNAQVFQIKSLLPDANAGTVDKFQGQEAPIVIYSMTSSSYADAPRGMEFLYSLNRLNVATSRAQCLCILVASPAVFEAQCRTPRQMQLANAFCRYLEMATKIELS